TRFSRDWSSDVCSSDLLILHRNLLGLETVFLELFREEVSLRDMQFFIRRVTAQLNHFHPVEKRTRDGFKRVRRRDEEDLREVVRSEERRVGSDCRRRCE